LRALRDERGQALVVGAFAVLVMALALVLAADLATVHLARARLQAACDAAALAAVQEASPQFQFEVTPVYATEFFPVGSQLPDPEQIDWKEPRYEWRDVYEYVVYYYDTRDFTWELHSKAYKNPPSSYPSYWRVEAAGWEKTGEERVLVGWDVRYVVGHDKRMTDAWLDLADWEASLAAREALRRNAYAWAREGLEFVGPWLADEDLAASKRQVQYTVKDGVLAVRTQLLGRLLGGSEYVFVHVRGQSAEVSLAPGE